MDRRKHPFKMRMSYWFDNKMAQGFGPKVRLLLIVTLIFVVIVGFLAALAHGGIHKNFLADFIRTFMYSLGKGGALSPDDANISVLYFLLMLLTIIYCMFFSSILIGLISNALRSKVENLDKGRSHVIEDGHTLILGFNDATIVLLREFIETNKNQKKPKSVVVLGETDQRNMIEEIQKKVGRLKRGAKTRIICRTGSIYNFDDLRRCSFETSRSVIINASNDFEAVKATMACSYLVNECRKKNDKVPFLVSVIQNDENLVEVKAVSHMDEEDNLIVLALNEVLARIMVHTSRQPGLSDVFTELFNFADDELYIFSEDEGFAQLYSKSIADINHYLQASFAVGVRKKDGSILIEAPKKTIFEEGDSLIVVKEDDDPLRVLQQPAELIQIPSVVTRNVEQVKVLIVGVEDVLEDVLVEYSNYLPSGSSICVVDSKDRFATIVTEETKESLRKKSIDISTSTYDMSQKKQSNELLAKFKPDSVLVLVNEDASNPDAEDELVMRILIYLREFRSRTKNYYSITCEMLQDKNKELAAATEPDDFIISRQFSALLMAQISQNKEMASLFENLLSSTGYEIYMKPAYWYVPLNKSLNLISVSHQVAEKGEIFIGLRQMINGHYQASDINPAKYDADMKTLKNYTFGEQDYLVVLAKNSQYPKGE